MPGNIEKIVLLEYTTVTNVPKAVYAIYKKQTKNAIVNFFKWDSYESLLVLDNGKLLFITFIENF